jgi:hypothetical protein
MLSTDPPELTRDENTACVTWSCCCLTTLPPSPQPAAELSSSRHRLAIRSGSRDRATHAVALDRDLALSRPAFSAEPPLE